MYVLRQYSLPILLALALHAAVALSLYRGWAPETKSLTMVQPPTVIAKMIVLEQKSTPTPAQSAPPPVDTAAIERQRREAEAAKAQERKKQLDLEKAAAEKAEAERRREEQEAARKEQERLERLKRLSELAETSLTQAIEDESANLQAGTEEQVAQSYRVGIYNLIRQNWSRPPSARNGMEAKLLVELIPTGELSSVTIVESSGNAAFDRSAEQAVRRAQRFDVPAENAIFEKHFRSFYFLFKPEDLLR